MSIDSELQRELDESLEKLPNVRRITDGEANDISSRIASKFVGNSDSILWWTSLSNLEKIISYGEGGDGLAELSKLIHPGKSVILIVTDESPSSWPSYSASIEDVIKIVGECRFFEYMVTDRSASWVVHDTHMNELIVSGRISS